MAKSLIIVESPAKANTIKKFFGKDFFIKASVGHLIDLPKNELGVDVENNFNPTYVTIKGKSNILKDLKDAAKEADTIYIAPDPDREGEAIAWHIANHLKKKKDVKIYRILFNEITKKTVQEAVKNPREIDKNKVDAQQTRRILDRLVGYKISPILWKKVRRGLSAGRVQSIAMRVIYERESEIEAFVQEEYWTVTAQFTKGIPPSFSAALFSISEKKPELKTESEAAQVLSDLKDAEYCVTKVLKKERKRNPYPPFITSTLQQDASRKHRYSAKRTMSIAQKLYEGIEIGQEGHVGLITYMRTDSTRVSDEAISQVRQFVESKYGKPFLPPKPNVYKLKKGSQDAHEAIRPTSALREPSKIQAYLKKEEMNIYSLIWKRFVSSQMKPAVLDITSVDITSGKYLFRATGSIIKFNGFMQLYTETQEGEDVTPPVNQKGKSSTTSSKSDKILPDLNKADNLTCEEIDKKQHFTQPPPRYSEATLIKELEDKGIGRPSTYAQIMSVIRDRDYVVEEERKFKPTDLGKLITQLLIDNFPGIMNIRFTADMETKLDDIEVGKRLWTDTLKDFYQPFKEHLASAEVNMKNIKAEITPTDVICEKCGSQMGIRWGKFGKFLACMKYPECKNTKPLEEDSKENGKTEEVVESDEVCKNCGVKMIVKASRFGKFLSCPKFPDCKFTLSISTGVTCPECNEGYVGVRYTKRGKEFYGCSSYPKCKFALWDRPIPEKCPICDHPFLVEKNSKKDKKKIQCFNKECTFLKKEGAD